ncbi:hypothetical protein [Flaviflexus equikiangi]|uniref:hypothetical protein n=1 Tax=Flaviflexus equikiangi TaxID=2758573 RepID=UPI0021755DAF|nr:hypothetical protein [Flaviflexus equikiangi]
MTKEREVLLPATEVTTGAGDAFIGCFSHYLVEDGDVVAALAWPTCTRRAQPPSWAPKPRTRRWRSSLRTTTPSPPRWADERGAEFNSAPLLALIDDE